MLKKTYFGFIAILGKTNSGKSTLFNKILSKKISIISHKINTTQKNILGVITDNNYQTVYIDTPGLYFFNKKKNKYKINYQNEISLYNINIILFVLDGIKWNLFDEIILNKIKLFNIPVIFLINKIDKINKKSLIFNYIKYLKKKINFLSIIPISSKNGTNINYLYKIILKNLLKSSHYFPSYYFTSESPRSIINETIRENVIKNLNKEIPYNIKIEINNFDYNKNINMYFIESIIIVKNVNQKKILIGKNGSKIKKISMNSRNIIEKIFNKKIFLKILIKINLINKK
ncbi:GTPase Era [Candidatus Annandia pinicola]|uniref:GTPase Era n=1 Tax=Candidatus Annandia pinicola TaxID=1345117 RepID=UPI001D02F7E8|nr:GTPase Era [Candidatus Annandia pinicola]UDG80323.1 GTPase Era [Candidatus Annandia pinicola]